MTKQNYMANLSAELDRLGVASDEKAEILGDFEQHFADGAANGLTERQICENLGDVREIAKQYGEGGELGRAPVPPVQAAQKPLPRFNGGGLAGIVCMDVFVFSWAVPVLFALVVSYFAVAFSFVVSGLTMAVASVFAQSIVHTSFPMFSVFLLGVSFLSLGGLGGLAGIYVWKGFVWCIKAFVNLHSNWVCGVNVFVNTKKEVPA